MKLGKMVETRDEHHLSLDEILHRSVAYFFVIGAYKQNTMRRPKKSILVFKSGF